MIMCKGRCDDYKKEWKKPYKVPKPFLTHSYCRRCVLWIKKGDGGMLWKNLRCPCCHGRVSNKPRLNKLKRKYIFGRVI
tara:strand:- start:228 stop:464 length:237 start_codon:yes stop_codon:yes gene_type:complete